MSFVDVPTGTTPQIQDVPGGRVAALRESQGLDAPELARLAGLSHDEIVAIENGQPMSRDAAQAIAAVLNVPAEALYR